VYEVEKNLKEHAEKIDGTLKTRIEGALGTLREALKGEDVDAIRSSTEALEAVWHEAAAAMYQATGAQGAPGSGEGEQPGQEAGTGRAKGKGGDGAVDADFEVVN
jgi:molecular chaperone DnaK